MPQTEFYSSIGLKTIWRFEGEEKWKESKNQLFIAGLSVELNEGDHSHSNLLFTDFGSPHARTTWELQNAFIEIPSSTLSAGSLSENVIVQLVVYLLTANVKNKIAIVQWEIKPVAGKLVVETIVPEKLVVGEFTVPFLIDKNRDLKIGIQLQTNRNLTTVAGKIEEVKFEANDRLKVLTNVDYEFMAKPHGVLSS